jgi:hypothetical protein
MANNTTDVRIESAKMLVKFFNIQAGTSLRTSSEGNQRVILEKLDAGETVSDIKAHIRAWVSENLDTARAPYGITNCMLDYKKAQPEIPQGTTTDSQINYSMGILEKAVIELISKTQTERIESEIMGQVQDEVGNFIKSEYGTIERKIVTVVDGKRGEQKGIQHEKFETILKFVANNEPVFLTGPAGSGKNVICKQVAEALGLNFYFTNAVTQEYKLTGFTDAMGNYQETQFYKAFTQGGVFMLDEMDASIPEVLVILNAAIANRYFDFPAPIGYVEAHPDFRVVAAGNTTGQGANFEYVGRNQLDGASLDRFAIVKVDYSKAIEDAVSAGNAEIADFCRDFRKAAMKAGLNIIVSYRAIGRLAKMSQILDTEEALETCLLKGIEKDDINMIYENMKSNSVYRDALARLMK